MPQHFTKHKKNTTFLKWKTNELFWRIEWLFPQADNIIQVTERYVCMSIYRNIFYINKYNLKLLI